jgi:hypothetical protein
LGSPKKISSVPRLSETLLKLERPSAGISDRAESFADRYVHVNITIRQLLGFKSVGFKSVSGVGKKWGNTGQMALPLQTFGGVPSVVLRN